MSLLTLTVEKNVVDEMSHAHARPGVSARRMLGVCIAVSVSATGPAHALTANIANCTVPYLQSFAPSNTHLTSAAIINATSTLPMYCRVDGTIDTPNSTARPGAALTTCQAERTLLSHLMSILLR